MTTKCVATLQVAVVCLTLQRTLSLGPHVSSPHYHHVSKLSVTQTATETMFLFQNFVSALREKQQDIIEQLEAMDGSGQKFTNDTWGVFDGEEIASGGLTRVLQGGDVIEKGACSVTLIQWGILSSEHAKSIRSCQHASIGIKGGDKLFCYLSRSSRTNNFLQTSTSSQ